MSDAAPAKKGKKKFELDPRLAGYKGVWVFVEHERGQVHTVSWELMGEGRKLADMLGVELAGVVLGAPDAQTRRFCDEAMYHGADLCYLMEDEILKDYRNEPFTKGMTDLVNTYQPEILLLGATTQGRDLAGSVATTLQTGLTADCTGLTIDQDNRSMAATRPTFGGSLLCTIVTLNYRPQMATVRPRVFNPAPRQDEAKGQIVRETMEITPDMINAEIVEFITNAASSVKLEYADIIVSGGRGLGGPKGFELIKELADALGGVVGSSRACVDAGWIKYDHQVGQTGKTVRPKLYVAAGISGAIQHKVGMQESDFILAINRDPHAPIFDVATMGIVGDLYEVIPAMIKEIRARKEA